MRIKFFVLFLAISFLLFGCTQTAQTPPANVSPDYESLCISACTAALGNGASLENGPCLGIIATDWVCDVAHNPRTAIDDASQNQCEEFGTWKAHHFVEVTPTCEFIRKY